MDWFGAGADGPLVVIRTVHLAATAVMAGSLIFRAVVAEPVWCSKPQGTAATRRQILLTAWTGLAIAVVSGMLWLHMQAASMSRLKPGAAMTSDVLLKVLNQTQFGLVLEIRLGLAVVLAGCLAYDRTAPPRWLGLASALTLTAIIAWTGHAGSTAGEAGFLHLAADASHLIAAAAWIGGLVSLVWLLAETRRDPAQASFARDATRRFSVLGITAVGTLLTTGIINAWLLVGSFNGLIATDYGRLLTLKIGLFAVMLGLAAVNRFWLTPRLKNGRQFESLRQLTRNSAIEIGLGLTIYAIVGVLGTLHPAIHFL